MDQLLPIFTGEISIEELTLSLLLALTFGIILNFIVSKFSNLVHSQGEYNLIFPILITVMVLIITIIKTSLVLSLGLVGALSIVRFRTPVKEPEELIYLFFAIATGLGLGAGMIIPTTITYFFICASIIFIKFVYRDKQKKGIYIEVETAKEELEENINEIQSLFNSKLLKYSITRINTDDENSSVTFRVYSADSNLITTIVSDLNIINSNAKILIIETPNLSY
jgi:uncharacterized membrane protein YhiD involved in acid resistance